MNSDDVHRQRRAYEQHKAPHSIPHIKPKHPAVKTLLSMAESFTRLAVACEALAIGEPYRRTTPAGLQCGLSVELPVDDAIFLANWLKDIRERYGAMWWLCSGCWQPQTSDVSTWLTTNIGQLAAPLCESCREHAQPDSERNSEDEGEQR